MRILYPPRPQGKVPQQQLARLEQRGKHIVQRKFRGSRNLIHRSTTGDITLYSRHGRKHLKYKMPRILKQQLASLAFESGKEYWLDSELMHPHIEDTVILYDVLQADEYLYGVNQLERLDLLSKICRNPNKLATIDIALEVSQNVWLAEWWDRDFLQHFQEKIHLDHIEGLVLRKKDSCLDNFGLKEYEIDWQIRCRKPGPNYQL